MFNDEELSRILSAHANGEMRRFGYRFFESTPDIKCCLYQAAIGVDAYWSESFDSETDALIWFDKNYNPGWPLGKFLRELEARGLA